MAKIFNITTPTEKLIATVSDTTAKASIIFTVTNRTDKPIRGIAQIQALSGTEESWLSLDGEPEKDFPAAGTLQFTVVFNKPLQPVAEGQTEPEETYPYRLNVASAVRPDEDFDEGPVATIFKPERTGTKKIVGWPWWIFLIIGVVALAIIGIILFFIFSGSKAKKRVPDVTSQVTTVEAAQKLIQDAGFTSEVSDVVAGDKKVGSVVTQDPGPNQEAEDNAVVKLTQPEKAAVPPIQNVCLVEAMTTISRAGLKVNDNITGNAADIQACTSKVQSTTPAAKTVVAKNSSVTLNFNCVPKPGKLCINIRTGDIKSNVKFVDTGIMTVNPKVIDSSKIAPVGKP